MRKKIQVAIAVLAPVILWAEPAAASVFNMT